MNNFDDCPLTINGLPFKDSRLLFSGEGTNARVWCTRSASLKIPKLDNKHKTFAAVFRDVFFQKLMGNFNIDLTMGQWLHTYPVPVACDQKKRPVSIAESVWDVPSFVRHMVANVFKIHARGIRHGDIHPHNICVSETDIGEFHHLVDFENAALKRSALQHIKLPTICAPEVKAIDDITDQSEVWSLGVTVASVCLSRIIHLQSQEQCDAIVKTAYEKNQMLGDFLKDTLQMDADDRQDISFLMEKYAYKPRPVSQIRYHKNQNVYRQELIDALINGVFVDCVSFDESLVSQMIECACDAERISKTFLT